MAFSFCSVTQADTAGEAAGLLGTSQDAVKGALQRARAALDQDRGLFVLTGAGDRIGAITRFHLDELYPRFGLATALPERPEMR